tara:strand:+ start:3251 stop:3406 length:156 start_codon:yes stop_codon:yes gene_type:complete
MIKKEITIDGKVYTVHSSTNSGLEAAVESLKKSVKRLKKQIKEEDDAISEE